MKFFFRILKVMSALVLIAVAGVSIISFAPVFRFGLFLISPGSTNREVRQLEIQPGTKAKAISELLHRNGVVSDADFFYVLCLLRKSTGRLQAGEYAFTPYSTPDMILSQIVSGKVIVRCATFPEGSMLREVARILDRQGIVSEEDILRLALDRDFAKELGISADGLEGYLFPETYCFTKKHNAAVILKTMVGQFHGRLPQEWNERARTMRLSAHDLVILASIVEKEAVVDSERSLIAAVFYNRLRNHMPLQSDPTAVYDLPDFSGPVTAAHLKRSSPYNTYQNKGLPPGPICNPGIKSLMAALYPSEVSYLYFVSNDDGTHHFSDTLAEHQKAVHHYRSIRLEKVKPE